jgi:hypothetical protein
MFEVQAFDGSVTENSLFKTFGTIKILCFELVVTLISCLIYFVKQIGSYILQTE